MTDIIAELEKLAKGWEARHPGCSGADAAVEGCVLDLRALVECLLEQAPRLGTCAEESSPHKRGSHELCCGWYPLEGKLYDSEMIPAQRHHPCVCGHPHGSGEDGQDDGCVDSDCPCGAWKAPPAPRDTRPESRKPTDKGLEFPRECLTETPAEWRERTAAAPRDTPREHSPGCPAIADDESDQACLDDAGRCACGASPCPDLDALPEEIVEEIREYARAVENTMGWSAGKGTWAARDEARAALESAILSALRKAKETR